MSKNVEDERNSKYDALMEFYVDHPGNLRARPQTFAASKLELFFHDIPIGIGTGFIYRYAAKYGLFTNWHVLAGAHPVTKVRRNTNGLVPNKLKFHISVFTGKGSFLLKPYEVSLQVDNASVWYERNVDDPTVDIAMIDLAILPDFAEIEGRFAYLRNQMMVNFDDRMQPEVAYHAYPQVGSDVFILGYPRGIAQGALPIWKKGSIASEPLFGAVASGAPVILVDALTKEGMSGAPVLYFGSDVLGDLGRSNPELSDARPWLVGIYAGREGVTEEEGDLSIGRVWKVEELDKLFNPNWRRPGPYLTARD